MGLFYLLVIARTDRNSGKCWIGTKAHRLTGPREHRRFGHGEAQATPQHLVGTGRGRIELGPSLTSGGGGGSSAPKVILRHP